MSPSAHTTLMPGPARRLAQAALLAAALATPAAQASTVYSDGAMALAGFSSMPTYTSPGFTLGSATVATGNPGPALAATTGRVSGQTGYSFVAGYLYNAFQWDPGSQGAVQSLDFAIDRAAQILVNGVDSGGLTLTGRALIEQGGQVYMSISPGVLPAALPAFTTISQAALAATDFGLFDTATGNVDFGVNPDFAGASMRFGFAMRLFISGTSANDVAELSAWADNFSLAVNSANGVPTPGSAALVLSGLLLAAAAGRLKRLG